MAASWRPVSDVWARTRYWYRRTRHRPSIHFSSPVFKLRAKNARSLISSQRNITARILQRCRAVLMEGTGVETSADKRMARSYARRVLGYLRTPGLDASDSTADATSRSPTSSLNGDDARGAREDLNLVGDMVANAKYAEEVHVFPCYARVEPNARSSFNVHVHVHGWLIEPACAARFTRKNKLMMAAARQIAGLPTLPTQPSVSRPTETGTAAQSEPQSPSGRLVLDVDGFSDEPLSMRGDGKSGGTDSTSVNNDQQPQGTSRPPSVYSQMTSVSEEGGRGATRTSSIASSLRNLNISEMRPRRSSSDIERSSQASGKVRKFLPRRSGGTATIGPVAGDAYLQNCHENMVTRLLPFMSKPVCLRAVTVRILARPKREIVDDEPDEDDLHAEHVLHEMTLHTDEAGHIKGNVNLSNVDLDLRNHELVIIIQDVNNPARYESRESSVQSVLAEPGITIISDVDDTIKHTAVAQGARELFRNTFVRDLKSLGVKGMSSWYKSARDRGAIVHYVSNSPWQIWPTMRAFFDVQGLPFGSVHLKQYSGFLQGILEPAGERKRANVESILREFPMRRFILVGDSAEQDLELYTDLAQAYSDRIVGIFMRDVTTPQYENQDADTATPEGSVVAETLSKPEPAVVRKPVSQPRATPIPESQAKPVQNSTEFPRPPPRTKSSGSLFSLDSARTDQSSEGSPVHKRIVAWRTRLAKARSVIPWRIRLSVFTTGDEAKEVADQLMMAQETRRDS